MPLTQTCSWRGKLRRIVTRNTWHSVAQPYDGIYACAPATVRGQPTVLSVDAKVRQSDAEACLLCPQRQPCSTHSRLLTAWMPCFMFPDMKVPTLHIFDDHLYKIEFFFLILLSRMKTGPEALVRMRKGGGSAQYRGSSAGGTVHRAPERCDCRQVLTIRRIRRFRWWYASHTHTHTYTPVHKYNPAT